MGYKMTTKTSNGKSLKPRMRKNLIAQEIAFAKILAGNDAKQRHRAVRKLKIWLRARINGKNGQYFIRPVLELTLWCNWLFLNYRFYWRWIHKDLDWVILLYVDVWQILSSGRAVFAGNEIQVTCYSLELLSKIFFKFLKQEELAESLSQLVHCFEENKTTALSFIRIFNKTLMLEWPGLDQHRIDKFGMVKEEEKIVKCLSD